MIRERKSITHAYQLSPDGLASLRANINRVQPWRLTRGPVTPQGKWRSSLNGWRHGHRSMLAAARREVQRADAAYRANPTHANCIAWFDAGQRFDVLRERVRRVLQGR